MNPKEAAENMSLLELVGAIENLAVQCVALDNARKVAKGQDFDYEGNAEQYAANEKTITIYAMILCRKVRKELL